MAANVERRWFLVTIIGLALLEETASNVTSAQQPLIKFIHSIVLFCIKLQKSPFLLVLNFLA